MRLLMITQMIDSTDPILGFAVNWIRALAMRVERLHVLCLSYSGETLPANVTVWSMGKDRGHNRLRELGAFFNALNHVIQDVDTIFCHMIPRYAWLSAPYAAAFRKPVYLWYTHRHVNLELRMAVAVCKYILTAAPDSFPLRTDKLRIMGHGIDTEFYQPNSVAISHIEGSPRLTDLPLIVQVARLMPIKHQATLLQALATGIDARLAIVGAVPTGQNPGYLTTLQSLARELGIADRVTFTGGLPIQATRDVVCQATIAVNLSPPGLFDKAALESMLMGVPTVVANPAFDNLLGDRTERLRIAGPEDVQGLSDRLRALLILPPQERHTMSMEIRERTIAEHSLDRLMDRMVQLMEKR